MYKELIDSLLDYVALIDINGNIIEINRAWKRFCNDNQGELEMVDVGVNYLTVLSNSNSMNVYNGIVEVLKGNTPFFHTSYACPLPNDKRWFSMIVSPLIESNKITGATVVHRNISDYENERLEVYNVLECMTDAFFTLSEDWKFSYVNKVAEELLFATKEELLGQDVWEKYPEAMNTPFEENYIRTMQHGEKTSFEEYFEPLETWFEVHSYPRENGGISVFFHNINEKKAKEDRLWDTAHHDHLTGLANRTLLYKKIQMRLTDDLPFVIYFLDLNNFKLVNDAYGHDIGDLFLLEITKRLQHDLPNKYFLSRFGGDEFILITDYIDECQVQYDVYQILLSIEKPIVNSSLPALNVSASLGVSIFPENGRTLDALITAADTAMYEAKKKTGVQWCKYENSMSESLNRRLLIEGNLKEAISTEAFYAVFQPQVDILKNEIIGIEVLSRWNHPKLGFISPNEFIPIAEETGQIRMLTEHTIENCLAQYNKWKKVNGFSGFISFNIPSSLLSDTSFVSFLLYQLEKHSIPKGTMEIEITENTQVFSSSVTHDHLNDIQQAGIRIAIDDFGVGYSNLSYISNMPISKLKIDKYFIDSIGRNQKVESILLAIISLANILRINVIAEGVETEEQRDFLKEHNCSLVQGFLYNKPLTTSQFLTQLDQYGVKYPENNPSQTS